MGKKKSDSLVLPLITASVALGIVAACALAAGIILGRRLPVFVIMWAVPIAAAASILLGTVVYSRAGVKRAVKAVVLLSATVSIIAILAYVSVVWLGFPRIQSVLDLRCAPQHTYRGGECKALPDNMPTVFHAEGTPWIIEP